MGKLAKTAVASLGKETPGLMSTSLIFFILSFSVQLLPPVWVNGSLGSLIPYGTVPVAN